MAGKLCDDSVDCLARIDELAEQARRLVQYLAATSAQTGNHQADAGWINTGAIDIQKGLMSLRRSLDVERTNY